MVNVRKRGKVFQYQFEIAPVDGVRKYINKSGFKTKAEADKENEVINADMYKEGGTMIYWYGTYTIIKSHSLDGNRDVYIGLPEMTLNSVR